MTSVYQEISAYAEHKPEYVYLNVVQTTGKGAKKKEKNIRIAAAYDLLLVNRDTKAGKIGQVFLEIGYAVTNPVDNFCKKTGREIAVLNLEDGGMDRKNYLSFFLGIGYDVEALEYAVDEGFDYSVPKSAIPMRLVGGENVRPWICARDYDLTAKVKEAVIDHFEKNDLY